MMHYFTWDNKNSLADFGLWISKLPKITRAPERTETMNIPGRAGSLILLEGDDVYDSYVRKCTITTRNTNPKLQQVLSWLRGTHDVVFSNEPDKAYTARIVNDINFDRIGNDLITAEIQFYCEPLKKGLYEEQNKVTMTASGTILNIGDVASRPIVKITANGDRTIVIGSMSMTFENLSGTIVVDCDAGIITSGGAIWTGSFTGDFWRIPKGQVTVTLPASTSIEIQPRWRWV